MLCVIKHSLYASLLQMAKEEGITLPITANQFVESLINHLIYLCYKASHFFPCVFLLPSSSSAKIKLFIFFHIFLDYLLTLLTYKHNFCKKLIVVCCVTFGFVAHMCIAPSVIFSLCLHIRPFNAYIKKVISFN